MAWMRGQNLRITKKNICFFGASYFLFPQEKKAKQIIKIPEEVDDFMHGAIVRVALTI